MNEMPIWRKLHVKVVDSLDLNDMPDDFTRLLWVLLPTQLDRCGRGIDNSAWVRSKVFPLREDVTSTMIATAMDWYVGRGMIERYEADDRKFFWIPTWHTYQGVTKKEAASNRPAPSSYIDPEPLEEAVPTNSGVGLEQVWSGDVLDSDSDSDADADRESDTDTDAPSPSMAPQLIRLLSLFNRKRFTNNAQRDQAEHLLNEHWAHFNDAARWASDHDWGLSEALNKMAKALPNWGKGNNKLPAKPKRIDYGPSMSYTPLPPDPLASTWAPILADLKGQMTQAMFDTQLKDAVLLSLDDPVRIGFVSEFACANVQSRLHKKMLATVRRHLGADVKVQYEVVA
jgi:hypothetical protein